MQVYNLKPPSPDIVQAYEALDTLPTSVLKQVVVPRKAIEAAEMVRTFLGDDRVGPANTQRFDPEALYNQALAGPDAVPTDGPAPMDTTDGTDRHGE